MQMVELLLDRHTYEPRNVIIVLCKHVVNDTNRAGQNIKPSLAMFIHRSEGGKSRFTVYCLACFGVSTYLFGIGEA